MEIKVQVGQIWEFNKDSWRHSIEVITHIETELERNEAFTISTLNTKGVPNVWSVASFSHKEEKALITDKYVGDWVSAIASPEFKGE